MIVLIWIGFAVLTAISASNRKRNVLGWSVLGFLFGPFALGAVLLMGEPT